MNLLVGGVRAVNEVLESVVATIPVDVVDVDLGPKPDEPAAHVTQEWVVPIHPQEGSLDHKPVLEHVSDVSQGAVPKIGRAHV